MTRLPGAALRSLFCAYCLLFASDDASFRRAEPGYRYSFPRDHFEHPPFRTEWWYYTGNLRDAGGRRFGFELVFFRQGQRRGPARNQSAWRVDDLYLAHLALTDIDGKRFYNYRRLNRAGPGVAGVSFERRRVWNANWSAQWEGANQTLEATAEEFRFQLRLEPLKPPVIQGVDGISRKGPRTGQASHYVSLPRMAVLGELWLGDVKRTVSGTAWMDHEWFTHQLTEDQTGWDWFSIQLDDQTELMLFQLRRKDGSIDPYSAATYVDGKGRPRHLTRVEFSLEPAGYWKSPATRANYPVVWRIRVPSLGISLDAKATINDQELASAEKTSPAYWEGAVTYTGSHHGVGYLEMTGYDKPVEID